jgi:hypothetical protein
VLESGFFEPMMINSKVDPNKRVAGGRGWSRVVVAACTMTYGIKTVAGIAKVQTDPKAKVAGFWGTENPLFGKGA